MRLYKENLIMARETISGQDLEFGRKLEQLISSILTYKQERNAKSAAEMSHCPAYDVIESLTLNRLGLRVTLNTESSMVAGILPFYSNVNHVFLKDYFRGWLNLRDQQRVLKKFENKSGSVDTASARLSGIFSEYNHSVHMNFYELSEKYGMTAAEITAVLLHEYGHAFSACEYADRVDETNQVMASISQRLTGDDPKKLEYVYREIQKIAPDTKKEEVDKLLNGPRSIAGATWFRIVHEVVGHLTMDSTYNRTAFEQQADAFSSRFGYGRQLISALEKFPDSEGSKSASLRAFIQITSTATLLAGALAAVSGFLIGFPAVSLVGSAFLFVFLRGSGEDMRDYTYDELKHRYLRVRADAIEQLKNKDLDKKEVQILLEAVYTIDDIVKDVKTFRTIPERIANFLFSSSRNASNSISDQQLMENLASNDLFVQAADFRANA